MLRPTSTPARVVMEVGTHSAWVLDVVAGCSHGCIAASSVGER